MTMFASNALRVIGAMTLSFVALALIGCGGGGGQVSGKVTYQGKAVEGGSVTFSPVSPGERNPGKPASGVVGKDGSFSLSERAVPGNNKVTYTAPTVEWDATKAKPGDQPPRSPYDGLAPKQAEIELKEGANTIEIELIKRAR